MQIPLKLRRFRQKFDSAFDRTVIASTRHPRIFTGVAIIVVALVGVGTLQLSKAAGPFLSLEAEGGSITGLAASASDTSASGGAAVQFGSSGGALNLPRIPWEGGPDYYKASRGPQFAKADAAGWDDPSFFPIYNWVCNPNQLDSIIATGANTCLGLYTSASSPSVATSLGLFLSLHDEEMMGEAAPGTAGWKPAQVGNDPKVVSWFVSDECEMGYSGCTDWAHDNGDAGRLSVQTTYANTFRSYNDGRFLAANFGNGVARTFWGADTMDDHLALLDTAGVDKYVYTSCEVREVVTGSPDWPAGANPQTSAGYGWLVDQMRMFSGDRRIPLFVAIETARPYLNESCAGTITPNQMEGAVWSSLIHEARAVLYFDPNNDPNCGEGSACDQASRARRTAVNAKIKSLAPVLNTQSYYNDSFVRNGRTLYRYSFNNGTDAMLKTYSGSAYIFADIGLNQTAGTKIFTLPAGVNGTTVEVVGENRSLPVNGSRQFTDSFAAEYTHHVYRINL